MSEDKSIISSGPQEKQHIVAIDLGSNSFHMAIACLEHGEIRIIERLGEKVQLGAGIGVDGNLNERAITRAIECLERFGQRLRNIDAEFVQVVGTNALRVAKNRSEFIRRARAVINAPIEVISGREEARLIYLGVSHTVADDQGHRLVIDIGGGSTEVVIGQRFESLERESLHMGCVSYRERYFPDGVITEQNFERAVINASRELLHIKAAYVRRGWRSCFGSSGSIKVIFQALNQGEIGTAPITLNDMEALKATIFRRGHTDALADLGIKKERLSIFPAGFAILYASFKVLGIDQIDYTAGALREGLLYDILGRIQHEDVRDRTVKAMQSRHHVDLPQATYVENVARYAYTQVAVNWRFPAIDALNLLMWASQLYELGHTISPAQYHKHGAYLLMHCDMPGFSRLRQLHLSTIVRCHRRKIPVTSFDCMHDDERDSLLKLCVLFRLVIVLTADRHSSEPAFSLEVDERSLKLHFPEQWIDAHPLTRANLEAEQYYLKKVGFKLSFW
jgi:exopolyphosphatase/guanosine-5'-triphosphate,3'-diphosphate pyrophosphatase